MRAPAAASSSEIARPMPREPPVTTAVFMRASSGRDYIHRPAPIAATRARRDRRGSVRSIHRDHLGQHVAGPDLENETMPRRAIIASNVSFQSVG